MLKSPLIGESNNYYLNKIYMDFFSGESLESVENETDEEALEEVDEVELLSAKEGGGDDNDEIPTFDAEAGKFED